MTITISDSDITITLHHVSGAWSAHPTITRIILPRGITGMCSQKRLYITMHIIWTHLEMQCQSRSSCTVLLYSIHDMLYCLFQIWILTVSW